MHSFPEADARNRPASVRGSRALHAIIATFRKIGEKESPDRGNRSRAARRLPSAGRAIGYPSVRTNLRPPVPRNSRQKKPPRPTYRMPATRLLFFRRGRLGRRRRRIPTDVDDRLDGVFVFAGSPPRSPSHFHPFGRDGVAQRDRRRHRSNQRIGRSTKRTPQKWRT